MEVSDANLLSCEAARKVERFLRRRDGYKVTPLISLPCLAREIGVSAIQLKDDISEIHRPEVKALAEAVTVSCATDGNHGRSVAQGAHLVGANCAIFVHSGLSEERIAAIARFGARILRVDGNYDDSVAEAARVAANNGWTTVSDTSWPGYERIPGLVMQGYTALVSEALRQSPEPPTHVFVQGRRWWSGRSPRTYQLY
ncbi:threonine dehydratase [Bradyrhizobium sp. F1.13.1]